VTPQANAGVRELHQAELTVRLRGDPTPTTSQTSLPLHWDVSLRRKAGWARVRLHFADDPGRGDAPQALFIARIANAYRVSLNGVLLAEEGALSTPNDGWTGKRPLWLRIPAPLLQPDNVLDIDIRADYLRRAGVSTVQVGPEAQLRDRWHASEWREVTLPRAVSIFGILVSAFCALLWWQQREPLYAAAGLWQLVWCLRVGARWWEAAPLSWPAWFQTTQILFWLGCVAGYALVHAVWGGRSRREQAIATGVLLAWLAATWIGPDTVLVTTALLVAAWGWLVVRLAHATWQTPDAARVWMLLATCVCWAALAADIGSARLFPEQYDDGGWTILAAAFTGVAVLAIVGQRFQRARNQLRELALTLERRVNQREAELATRHAAMRGLERIAAKTEGRARILRDMHDGAGAHLITAMRQIEGGRATQSEVLQTLRESLDQLRLSVDAMSLPVGDINALLASLRFRLQPRIEAAGMALQWEVDLLPLWASCTEEAMHHLQYILFEAVSNALQHAQARELALAAHAIDGVTTIDLSDDGVGFQRGSGNGMRTMQERAELAGVELAMRSGAHGSGVRIVITHARA
jgi:signal transduction histidine kinase